MKRVVKLDGIRFYAAFASTLFARPRTAPPLCNRRTRLLCHSSRWLRQTRRGHHFCYWLVRHRGPGLRGSTMCLPRLGPHPYLFHRLVGRGRSLPFLFRQLKRRLGYNPVLGTEFADQRRRLHSRSYGRLGRRRAQRGSPAFIPRSTGNEYVCVDVSSISAPLASISEIRGPTRANATAVRS